MSNYIVYKRVTCELCYGYSAGKYNCSACEGKGNNMVEVDLEDALKDLICREEYVHSGSRDMVKVVKYD